MHIGDDGAIIDKYVYSKDAFFENVHFKTKWMSHYQIASKAMNVIRKYVGFLNDILQRFINFHISISI